MAIKIKMDSTRKAWLTESRVISASVMGGRTMVAMPLPQPQIPNAKVLRLLNQLLIRMETGTIDPRP